MKYVLGRALSLAAVLIMNSSCDSEKDPVTTGREAVKEVVTRPFNTFESAKDSLNKSEDKTKAAIEEFDKETKH